MRHASPPLAALALVLVACSSSEPTEETATKTAAALCEKLEACGVPWDEGQDVTTCTRGTAENIRTQANGRRSACSAAELETCRAAIREADCASFVPDLVVDKRTPAACAGC